MRKTSLLFAAAAVFGITTTSVQAADVTAQGTAKADILEQLEIAAGQVLEFGKIDKPSSLSQDFVVTAAGSPETSGTGAFIGGGQAAGKFNVKGRKDQAIFFQTGEASCGNDSGVTLTLQPANGPYVLDVNGMFEYAVGGKLNVSSTTPAGAKTCTYNVTVSYDNLFPSL